MNLSAEKETRSHKIVFFVQVVETLLCVSSLLKYICIERAYSISYKTAYVLNEESEHLRRLTSLRYLPEDA